MSGAKNKNEKNCPSIERTVKDSKRQAVRVRDGSESSRGGNSLLEVFVVERVGVESERNALEALLLFENEVIQLV